ncbi:MAG: hypothetical protein M1485_06595 [Chloroflexi bacterium]|nr:hypothetical protein [Chloroflexota bacterium]
MQTNWIQTLALASLIVLTLTSCAPAATASPQTPLQAASPTEASAAPEASTLTVAATSTLTETATSSPTETPAPTKTSAPTSIPTMESLKAQVTADLLSCRFGPSPFYLYLYGLAKGANIKLIGRTDGNNWVYVDGKNKRWVNASFIEIAGDRLSLPVVYPGIAKLPQSPYYPPTTITSATRKGNQVTVEWTDVYVSPGHREDENMRTYIIEVWRCEAGQMIFDPLATNDTSISFIDEPGCSQPSHGRVFVQEKHGFAGPAEIPWPTQK